MTPRAQILILLFGFGAFSLVGGCSDRDSSGTDVPDTVTPADTSPDDVDIDPLEGLPDNIRSQTCADYYRVIPLPVADFGGPTSTSGGFDINNRGWIVGKMEQTTFGSVPYVWRPYEDNGETGEFIPLEYETPEGEEVFEPNFPAAINDSGQVVGTGNLLTEQGWGRESRGFYWNVDDGMTLFPGGEVFGFEIAAINNNGTVVGHSLIEDDADRYVSGWTWNIGDAELTHMPRVPGAYSGFGSMALGINTAGVIVGRVQDYHEDYHPVKYTTDTVYTKLPNFQSLSDSYIGATAVNNLGQVVGMADKYVPAWGGGIVHPVLWEANGTMHDLGILSNDPQLGEGEPTDINDSGVVVGFDTNIIQGRSYAWVWCGGIKRALEDMMHEDDDTKWQLGYAFGINNEGQIAVSIFTSAGGNVALMIPENYPIEGAD